MTSDSDYEIEGEVTRVEAVKYLEGATGHATFSLAMLTVGGVIFWVTDLLGVAIGCVAAASLLSANGISIYAWKRIRERIVSNNNETNDTTSTRELAPPSLSQEYKATHLNGLIQTGTLIATIAIVFEILKLLGPQTGTYLLGGGLAVGNLIALLRVWRTTTSRR